MKAIRILLEIYLPIKEEVILLVARRCGLPVEKISPDTSFYRLGIDGEDAVQLLEAFCEQFTIDPATIELSRYTIGPEGWGMNLRPRESISLKWAKPSARKDLMIRDLIASAENNRWFDPGDTPHW